MNKIKIQNYPMFNPTSIVLEIPGVKDELRRPMMLIISARRK